MRIAFVLGSTPPRHGREEDLQALVEHKGDWLGDEAMAVAALGHEVSIHLMYHKNGRAAHGGVEWFFNRPLISGGKLLRGGKEYCPRLYRSLEAWKPDLVHYQIISHAINYALCTRWARRKGVPIVGQHHGDQISPFPWNNAALGWAGRRSDAVVFLTRHHLDLYRQKFGFEESRSHLIPVGYNEYFHKRDREECRRKTGLTGDPILFWAAMLNERKDPLTLLEGFRTVSARHPGARLYMAGNGPIEEEVKAFVAGDPALSKTVTLLGYRNNSELPDYLNAADIYVMASHWEGFAISSMEAMACGALPVLTRIPCFVEQTENGRWGLLFEAGNRKELEENLDRAVVDVEWRETLRSGLPEHIAQYTWHASAEKLAALYERIVAERGSRGAAGGA